MRTDLQTGLGSRHLEWDEKLPARLDVESRPMRCRGNQDTMFINISDLLNVWKTLVLVELDHFMSFYLVES